MFLDPKNITLKQFQLDQGQKADNYVMKSDANGVVSWVAPSYFNAAREFEHYIGEHFAGGIVVSVWRDGGNRGTYSIGDVERCLIVATQDITYEFTNVFNPSNINYTLDNRLPWSDVLLFATASSSAFGASNSAKIMAMPNFNAATSSLIAFTFPSNDEFFISPAPIWCDRYVNPNLGTGRYGDWYLPSVYELTAMFSNVTIVNKVLEQLAAEKGASVVPTTANVLGGNVNSPINYVSGDYWCSTEKNASTAYIVNSSLKIVPLVKSPQANQFYYTNSLFRKARPFRTDTRRWNGLQWVKDRKNTGLVLIVYNTGAILTTQLVANITSVENSQGNTVTVISTYAALTVDLTNYDHIWDMNVSQDSNTLLNPVIDKYTDYLSQGGAIFILGENSLNFPTRGNSIASFIQSLGGGTVTFDPNLPFVVFNCTLAQEFLLANNTNTLTFPASGRFSSIGNGTSMCSLAQDLGPNYPVGTPNIAAFWKTGSLTGAPLGAIAVVLDVNLLGDYFSNPTYGGQAFAANLAKVLDQV